MYVGYYHNHHANSRLDSSTEVPLVRPVTRIMTATCCSASSGGSAVISLMASRRGDGNDAQPPPRCGPGARLRMCSHVSFPSWTWSRVPFTHTAYVLRSRLLRRTGGGGARGAGRFIPYPRENTNAVPVSWLDAAQNSVFPQDWERRWSRNSHSGIPRSTRCHDDAPLPVPRFIPAAFTPRVPTRALASLVRDSWELQQPVRRRFDCCALGSRVLGSGGGPSNCGTSALWASRAFCSSGQSGTSSLSSSPTALPESVRKKKQKKKKNDDKVFSARPRPSSTTLQSDGDEVGGPKDLGTPSLTSSPSSSPSLLAELLSRWKPLPDLVQHVKNSAMDQQDEKQDGNEYHRGLAVQNSSGVEGRESPTTMAPPQWILKARRRNECHEVPDGPATAHPPSEVPSKREVCSSGTSRFSSSRDSSIGVKRTKTATTVTTRMRGNSNEAVETELPEREPQRVATATTVPRPCAASSASRTVVPLEDPLLWLQQDDDPVLSLAEEAEVVLAHENGGESEEGVSGSAINTTTAATVAPTPLQDQLRDLEAYYLHRDCPGEEEEGEAAPSDHHECSGSGSRRATKRRSTTVQCRDQGEDGEVKQRAKRDDGPARSKRATFLVFNIFTRRVVQATSPSLQRLRYIGVGIDPAQRQLYLQSPELLMNFVKGLKEKTLSWPQNWSSMVFHRFRRLLEATSDPSEAPGRVQAFLHSYQTVGAQSGHVNLIDAWQTLQSNPDPHLYAGPSTSSAVANVAPMNMTTTTRERLLSESDLTEEQRRVLSLALDGHHLYVGGSAGTGKTVLLRVLRRRLAEEGLSVAVTATTGLAAFHIGGTTLHHRFGISLDGRIRARQELALYDVLIIDEVSMLPRSLFEELERQLRLAHRNHLPFGGVQVILCGDFMQLGAIAAETIVNAPVFRQNFVMLKLMHSLRQEKNPVFFLHLQALRLGRMLPSWSKTVQFIDTYEHVAELEALEQKQKQSLQEQQHHEENESLQLSSVVASEKTTAAGDEDTSTGVAEGHHPFSALPKGTIVLPALPEEDRHHHTQYNGRAGGDSGSEGTSTSATSSSALPAIIVEDAVNLLPTNALVRQANDIMLSQLEGERVELPAMVLTPFVQDKWSPSYLLAHKGVENESEAAATSVDLEALRHALLQFVLSCVRPLTSGGAIGSSNGGASSTTTTSGAAHDEDVEDLQLHPERHIVVYQLYEDGYVFRVRIPLSLCNTPTESLFLNALDRGLNDFLKQSPSSAMDHLSGAVAASTLKSAGLGSLCQKETLPTAEGLQTEQDEYILQQYVMQSQMMIPLVCKVGARVMLRTNLSRQLVNGSVGTIVGFTEMKAQNLSAYQLRSCPEREGAIQQYADFLRYEHGFATPLMPLVDFGDGQPPVAIPPAHFPVGGFVNTHFYTGGTLAIPLTLAYAFTVHKVQGLTLVGRVHLELSRMWPCEHLLYVAMSRVKNPEQLSISNFHISLLRVAADCLLFDQSLPSVDKAKVLPYFIPATWITDPSKRKRAVNRQRRRRSHQRRIRFSVDGEVTAEPTADVCDIEAIQSLFLSRLKAR